MKALHQPTRLRPPTRILLWAALGMGFGAAQAISAHNPASDLPLLSATTSDAAPGVDRNAALRASQAVVGDTPRDYILLDREGRPVRLSGYRGKPLLVNFIYTGCFHICPTSTLALHRAVGSMRDRFGANQFNVVSIGFNQPTDSPAALKVFAAQQRISDPNWEFLSLSAADVAALSREFGFSYAATSGGFDHTLQVTLVDAQGRIYRQIYGDRFSAAALGEPLKQLLTGARIADGATFADLIDRVRILCSVYDPETGSYRADYTLYLEIAGGLTFLTAMLGLALAEWRARVVSRHSLNPTVAGAAIRRRRRLGDVP